MRDIPRDYILILHSLQPDHPPFVTTPPLSWTTSARISAHLDGADVGVMQAADGRCLHATFQCHRPEGRAVSLVPARTTQGHRIRGSHTTDGTQGEPARGVGVLCCHPLSQDSQIARGLLDPVFLETRRNSRCQRCFTTKKQRPRLHVATGREHMKLGPTSPQKMRPWHGGSSSGTKGWGARGAAILTFPFVSWDPWDRGNQYPGRRLGRETHGLTSPGGNRRSRAIPGQVHSPPSPAAASAGITRQWHPTERHA